MAARMDPSQEKFVNDVRRFYAALAVGDGPYTYEGRTNSFKKSVPRELYLSTFFSLREKLTGFSYKVLANDEFVLGGVKKKRLIVKFDRGVTRPEYSVVWWKFEDGQWRCEEVGFRSIPFFNRFESQDE
jgi:hypothetical protein